MVATDVDGTLLDPDDRVSPRAAAVIGRLVAAGVGFVLVTGRPPRWIPPVVTELPIARVAVGMSVADSAGEEVGTVAAVQMPGTDVRPDLAAGDAERLVGAGYLRIDASGLFAKDLYAAGDQIASSVEGEPATGCHHRERVGAQRLDAFADRPGRAVADRDQQDDGGHADQDAQHGQRRAQLVGRQPAQREPDDLGEAHRTPTGA